MKAPNALICHIGHSINREIDPSLSAMGFAKGLLLFALPDLGILFKCRASGTPFAIETAALCSALQFICNDVDRKFRRSVLIRTSFPPLLFAVHQPNLGMAFSTEQKQMLDLLRQECGYTVTFVEQSLNRALRKAGDLASIPVTEPMPVTPNRSVESQSFGELQTGILL
jgi:hypothetical protein